MIQAASEPSSIHRKILDDIRDRIVTGTWRPGTRIPFEHQLATQYGCSRMTVNKALSQLARSGLIERRRRAGSFVRAPLSQAAILEIHDIGSEVRALGLPYRYQLQSRTLREADASDLQRLSLAGPSDIVSLHCRHFAGEWPFCHERRLIDLAAVPDAAHETFDDIAPGEWLIARVPWSAAEHTIRAVAADAETAAALRLPLRSPCLMIERRTWSAEQPVTQVCLTYPAERHSVVARFTPSKG